MINTGLLQGCITDPGLETSGGSIDQSNPISINPLKMNPFRKYFSEASLLFRLRLSLPVKI
jgi:hypothetical protein